MVEVDHAGHSSIDMGRQGRYVAGRKVLLVFGHRKAIVDSCSHASARQFDANQDMVVYEDCSVVDYAHNLDYCYILAGANVGPNSYVAEV